MLRKKLLLLFVGRKGLYNTSGGLKIAYLSGVESVSDKTQQYEFNKEDALSLRDKCLRGQPNFRGVDILLTSQWPKGVYNLDLSHKVRCKKFFFCKNLTISTFLG